jgi:uncharacterized protein
LKGLGRQYPKAEKALAMLLDADASARVLAFVRSNPINASLLDRLPSHGLSDCWLVAGCLFQTVWNVQSGRPPAENIKDYDVFYFDRQDLSYEAEDREIKRLESAFADLGATIELKNQARVHLWYEQRFGHSYPALCSATDGIDRFLIASTCIGVSCRATEPPLVYSSYGVEDLYAGILSPNPLNHPNDRFAGKAESYKARWPWLRIEASA